MSQDVVYAKELITNEVFEEVPFENQVSYYWVISEK